MGGENTKKLVIEITGDSFNEGKGSSDWVGGETYFAVDVAEDEGKRFLDFVEVSGGEELV